MQLDMSRQLAPQQVLGVSAELVASVEMLALRPDELADEIRRELDDNPALLLDETPERAWSVPGAGGAAPDFEPVRRESDVDRLTHEMRLVSPESEHWIADELISSLDDRGYLDAEVDEMANRLGVAPARVQRVLAQLQRIGPPGIAARDLSECLTLQLDRLRVVDPALREVIRSHLAALAEGRYADIAAAVGVSRHEILRVRSYIRSQLQPYPGFSKDPWGASEMLADVVVEDGPAGLSVRLTEPERFALRVCPLYAEVASGGTASERGHADARVQRAHEFTSRLERRWDTMTRVAEAAVRLQADFVRRGCGPKRSLTRVEVARALGLHESTVSRAVRDRHVRLPAGRVVALSELFGVADSAREALRALLLREQHPLTDAQLAEELISNGHRVARRTVAKYRAQLGQPQHARR
jgi:RNA polymerase sigma-54 factor